MAFQSMQEIMQEYIEWLDKRRTGQITGPFTNVSSLHERYPQYSLTISNIQKMVADAQTLSPDLRKKSVSLQIAESQVLTRAVEVEPIVAALLQVAASQPPDRDKWIAYEVLKRIGTEYVGWYARAEELQTAGCYNAYIEAMSSLLPDVVEDDVREDDSDDDYE